MVPQWTMKKGFRRGVLKKFTDIYRGDNSSEFSREILLHAVVNSKVVVYTIAKEILACFGLRIMH